MKSPDQEARDLARIIIAAAWRDPDHMVPVATLRALRMVPAKISKFPLAEAARWLDIPTTILEQESTRFLRVQRLAHGSSASGGSGCGSGTVTAGSRRPRGRGNLTRSDPR